MIPPGSAIFADETKSRGFVMVAAAIPPDGVMHARRDLRRLLMPGQSSVHFRSESDRRRRMVLDVLLAHRWTSQVLVAGSRIQREARDACLDHLVLLAADSRSPRLVLETDDSLLQEDRRRLFEAVRRHPVRDAFEYRHLRRREEPCLWAPDAIAWCFARGGAWRTRVAELIDEVVAVG